MPLRFVGRVLALALIVFAIYHTVANAHALPGTAVMTIPQDDGMTLSLQMPVEDLMIAAPELVGLEDTTPGTTLDAADMQALSNYLQSHMMLTQDNRSLPIMLEGAAIPQAEHHDVGFYPVLDVTLAPLDVPPPLTLRYDVIMHEVRTHRTAILRASGNGPPVLFSQFGYRPVNGILPDVVIERP